MRVDKFSLKWGLPLSGKDLDYGPHGKAKVKEVLMFLMVVQGFALLSITASSRSKFFGRRSNKTNSYKKFLLSYQIKAASLFVKNISKIKLI